MSNEDVKANLESLGSLTERVAWHAAELCDNDVREALNVIHSALVTIHLILEKMNESQT